VTCQDRPDRRVRRRPPIRDHAAPSRKTTLTARTPPRLRLYGAAVSYDVAVWVGPQPVSDETAREEFRRRSSRGQRVKPSAAIAGYVAALTARYPDLGDEDGESPWAAGPLLEEADGDFIYIAISASAPADVLRYAVEVATHRGLVCFDPQAGKILTPDAKPKRWPFRARVGRKSEAKDRKPTSGVPRPASAAERREVARHVAEALTAAGCDPQVEDRGHTVTWPLEDQLRGVIFLNPDHDGLFVAVGVQHEPTASLALKLTEHEREMANVKPSEIFRASHVRANLNSLVPTTPEYDLSHESMAKLCADIVAYGVPYALRQRRAEIAAGWEAGNGRHEESSAFLWFCYLIQDGQPERAVNDYEQYLQQEQRPAAHRVKLARLERARDLGLIP
jgi:hypothetical protein